MLTSYTYCSTPILKHFTLYRIVISTFTGSANKVGRWRGGRQITYLSTFTGSATKIWGGGDGGVVARFLFFFKFWNPIELILCPYHLFRMFPKVDITTVNPPKFFFSIFEAGDGGGGVTLNIIYGGGALNVDQLLTYCSTPILKHFTLYRIVLSTFTGSATKVGRWGGGRQIVKFLNIKILLTICLYHLFRIFSKIRSWYSHLKSPKLSFSNFFNIIFLGEGR